MAKMMASTSFMLKNIVRANTGLAGLVSRRWQTAQHTLAVRKKIEETRVRARQAGGPKRIETQHKKVERNISQTLLTRLDLQFYTALCFISFVA